MEFTIFKKIGELRREILLYFAVNVIGNVLPLIIGVLFYFFVAPQWMGWSVFFGDGQFYLYAATLFTSAGYIFLRYVAKIDDTFGLLAILSFVLLVFVSLFYAWKLSVPGFDTTVLFWTSVPVFFISLVLYFIASRVSHEHADPEKYKLERLKELMKPKNLRKPIDKIVKSLPNE
ncbi:MAG: hypothetical protein KA746_11845 [Pyrinomonadaceae bacterium]|nr:hypothetical protein [Pyrinomonadaceae bacterium]MBP6211685.1 hypothetical protein [Pyrinomonadaceae bacterium]